jgi:hypothetical protein
MSQDNDSGSTLPPPPPPPTLPPPPPSPSWDGEPPEVEGSPVWEEKPKRKRGAAGQMLTWVEVWRLVITEPTEESFETVLADPQASANRAYTWVFIAGLIGGVLNIGAQSIWGSAFRNMFNVNNNSSFDLSPICGVICVPVGAALAVVFLIISVGLQHLVARAIGGKGIFDDLVYASAAFAAPLSLISSALGMVPVLGCFSLFLGFYALGLSVIAVKAVHRLDTGRAILAVFWWIPAGALCCGLFVAFIVTVAR